MTATKAKQLLGSKYEEKLLKTVRDEACMYELHEQLLRTKLYQIKRMKISQSSNASCRMSKKAPESLAHVLSGC